MMTLLIISILFFVSTFYLYIIKGSILDFSFFKGNYIGVGLIVEMFFFIFPGVFLISVFGVGNFWALFTITEAEAPIASAFFLIGLFFLFLLFFIFMRAFFKSTLMKSDLVLSEDKKARIFSFSLTTLFCLVFFNIVVYVKYGYTHALLSSIFGGESLSILRYDNVDSSMPSFFVYFFIINSYILASLVPFLSRNKSLLLFFFALYFSSISGQKMPLVNVILIVLFCYMTVREQRVSLSLLLKFILAPLVIIFALYYIVKLQYPYYNLDLFVDYLLNRVGVGFVAGMYEQFHLRLHSFDYFWHSVPFANIFIDTSNFHKDLMMISESRIHDNNIGIKNTLFFAEAYAVGGYTLLLLSPFIYAFNYLLSIVLLIKFFKTFAIRSHDVAQISIGFVFMFFVNLTGGFSDIFLFKTPILIFLFLGVPVFVFYIKNNLFSPITK